MADATAHLHNHRQSPRKVGVVADAIRGKRVPYALASLNLMPKRAAGPLGKLLNSAVANARSKGIPAEELVISKIQVGKGMMFKRSTPRARGSSALIRKKASHVTIELSQVQKSKIQSQTSKVTESTAKAEKTEN